MQEYWQLKQEIECLTQEAKILEVKAATASALFDQSSKTVNDDYIELMLSHINEGFGANRIIKTLAQIKQKADVTKTNLMSNETLDTAVKAYC